MEHGTLNEISTAHKIMFPCFYHCSTVLHTVDPLLDMHDWASEAGWTPYCLFVSVEVLRPSQPNGVMLSAVNLPNHTFTGQTESFKPLTSIVQILLPETDKCPSWISGRVRMTLENISWSISMKECCPPWRGSNPRPPGLQLSHRGRLDPLLTQ